jgi:hypothetical protein
MLAIFFDLEHELAIDVYDEDEDKDDQSNEEEFEWTMRITMTDTKFDRVWVERHAIEDASPRLTVRK